MKPLKVSSPLTGLGGSEEEALIVAVPSSTSSTELAQIDHEIKAIQNSEYYQDLAYKNRPWALPKPTEDEVKGWRLLKENLDKLQMSKDYIQKSILSANSRSVRKLDKVRKGYKKDTAIKDERLLLSDIAKKAWKRFFYPLDRKGQPTFGDLKRAAGFYDNGDVCEYFLKRGRGELEADEMKEALTEDEWVWLIEMNQRVNGLLHGDLITNEDGSLRLVLEHDYYEEKAELAKNMIRKWYGPEKIVDTKDAASNSSASSSPRDLNY